MLISGQPYLLTCIVSLNTPTHTSDEAIDVQWLNISSNGTTSRITSHNQVSVGNLTGIRRNEYTLTLNLSEVEIYQSGEYACWAEIDRIIRKNTITLSVNRMSVYMHGL